MKTLKRVSTFGDRLKEYRENNTLTLADVEKLTQIPAQTLNRYELKQRAPKVDVANDIADKLNINPVWLSGYDVPINKNNQIYSSFDNIIPIKTKKLPLLGEIACGEPVFAETNIEMYVDVENNLQADFCLVCKGDSMIGARIHNGDLVFIKKQPMVENGEIAAVIVENDATLKRVFFDKENGKLVLSAENPAFAPLVFVGEELNQIHILGKAVAFQSNL